MRDETRYADSRATRRNLSGTEAGAASGATVGLLVAALVPGVLAGALLAIALGAGAGALAGRAVVTRASVDDWDRNPSGHPFVGAHTPDEV